VEAVETSRPVWIVTDSTADFPAGLVEQLPVSVVPLIVEIEGTSYRDRIDLTPDEFLARLRRGVLPRTSQPSAGAFQEVYQQLLGQGYDVVSIHIAGQLSGTLNSARVAAQAVDEQRVHLYDSGSVSMGLGWLVIEAAELAAAGQPAGAIVEHLDRRRRDVRLYAVLETLEYLQKGGRIGRAAAFLGSTLQIKPLISVREGVVEPVERVRTFRRGVERLIELAREQAPFHRLAVLHLGAEAPASELREQLQALQPELPIPFAQIGTVVGTYAGPGTLGFAGLVRRLG
jgi:DegV family protein with EDD domain